MERLDECLKVHADMLDAQNIGSIYELQGFSELHYYLKVEHVFTPAEVEALLSFQDPLDVARWCWEENNHEHSFPICDLLKEIDAEQKFEHFTSEPSAQDKYTLLMKRLGQNYFAYRESLMSRDKESLIEKAAEITAMQEAYSYLTTKFEFRDEMLDDVLALENPLKYFADRWLMPVSDVFDVDMVVMAIGQGPNPLLKHTTPDLVTNRKGLITVDEKEETSIPGVFAGGDIVTGAATVISAMGAGKKAALEIDAYLKEKLGK